jgi:two-component system cell cycle response regulator
MGSPSIEDDFGSITAETQLPPDALPAGPWYGTLTVLRGASTGAFFSLNPQATLIGRSPNAHLMLADDNASRNHARILCNDGHYEIEDLGSTNGTFVGGQRIDRRVLLLDGARIQIGNTLLRFALQDPLELSASKRVYEASVRDGLTGMLNRRYFEERIAGEFGYAARHGSALSVMLIDVDHFKRVNDTFGHQVGDAVLSEVAAQLRAAVRAEDVAARYGGEEFAVLARGIDVNNARRFAERLRTQVERCSIMCKQERVPVTISIGLAHNHAGAALSKPEQLLAAADQALYAAKANGRNRVELARSQSRYSMRVPDDAASQDKRRTWDQATTPNKEGTTNGGNGNGSSSLPPNDRRGK